MEVTRISDLPDNNGVGGGGYSSGGGGGYSSGGGGGYSSGFSGGGEYSRDAGSRGIGMGQQQYQPLNIHQNPYGIPEPTDTQLPTLNSNQNQMIGGGSGGFNGESMQRAPPSMLNRGMPQDTEMYQNDEQVRPNHVPTAKLTTDYLREYEDRMVKMTDEHQKDKHRKELIGSLYDEFQTPILIGVLFFLFQIPIINTLMFKYLSFMKIYNDDGNLNLYGLMFKSLLFGLTYFGFVRLTTYV
jgi:hypothetical protein